jgi:predicted ribosome quality control (RQC) complex YloA/Tae2 family protein
VGWEKIQAPVSGVIYVGKSAKGNDELLRTKAQKGDLWFHVKDAPGAHVLLTNRTGKDPDPKDIEFAARLALDRSRVGSDSKHEVMMADVKDVRKVKGSPFGQVRVDRSRTVHARGRFNNDQE